MKFKPFLVFLAVIFVLLPGAGSAFVFDAPHLLYRVAEKIKEPIGISVDQVRRQMNPEHAVSSFDDLEEKLVFSFPGRFRSQVVSGPMTGMTVQNDTGFVKVVDGQPAARAKSLEDHYWDILLYRDYERLLDQLEQVGIDTRTVSFQRYNGRVCYVIGDARGSGLWIEKETFFPIKYVIEKEGRAAEFFYDNWQRVSKTWYPLAGSIFISNQLLCLINVTHWELESRIDPSLFDQNRY